MADVDTRVDRAQALYWAVEPFRRAGTLAAVKPKLLEMAALHEERALDFLGRGDPEGWTDLHAGVTAYGDAGEIGRGSFLLLMGYKLSKRFERGRGALIKELEKTTEWLLERAPKGRAEAEERAPSRLSPRQAALARSTMIHVWERRFGRVTRAFAEELGCSPSTVNGIVRGQSTPSVGTTSRLARYLGVSLKHLLDPASSLPSAPQDQAEHRGKLRRSA